MRGDDEVDDSAGIQAAVDKAGAAVAGGIVMLAGSLHRHEDDYVWRAVRLVGYGPPSIARVPAGTPGFQKGIGVMALFTSIRQGQRVPAAWRLRRRALFRPTTSSPTRTRPRSIRG